MDDDPAEVTLPPEPDRRLGRTAPLAWVATGVGTSAGIIAALAVALPVLKDVDGLPGWVRPALLAAGLLACAVLILVRPVLLTRTWRYSVRPDEIDLRRGWLVRTRTIIPMTRVQHVDTQQSGIGALFDVQTLKIHTAAGEHEIPYLEQEVANHLRTTIAERAHVPDEL